MPAKHCRAAVGGKWITGATKEVSIRCLKCMGPKSREGEVLELCDLGRPAGIVVPVTSNRATYVQQARAGARPEPPLTAWWGIGACRGGV